MFSSFNNFKKTLQSTFKIANRKLMNLIQSYSFFLVCSEKDLYLDNEIIQNIQNSPEVIISYLKLGNQINDNRYLIISFKKTLIIIEPSYLNILYELFSSKSQLIICFLPESKQIFDKNISIQYNESENQNNFTDEITCICKNMLMIEPRNDSIRKFWKTLIPSISEYLIIQSYYKTIKGRIKNFYINNDKFIFTQTLDEKDYIVLKNIGAGSSFKTILIYHIESEELLVIKQGNNDFDVPKLLQREIRNYSQISYPLLPEFFCTTTKGNWPVIEFISGSTLALAKNHLHLNLNEKITIIFQLLIIFQYLHQNGFIYRDLKPNNIIINQNKEVVLIDFDSMIHFDDFSNDPNHEFTFNFGSKYMAPEILSGSFSYEKCDIYSLGAIIYFIIGEKDYDPDNLTKIDYFYPIIEKIFKLCTDKKPYKRPDISNIIEMFYTNDNLLICIEDFLIKYDDFLIDLAGEIVSEAQFSLGLIYWENSDFKKSFQLFTLASNKNNAKAHLYVGVFYLKGILGMKDISKCIHYFTLSAKQNCPEAFFDLSLIYLKEKYDQQDVQKGIYYLQQAANFNIPDALTNLGLYLCKGVYVPQDINKGFYYMQQAANQNYPEAQYNLGNFYLKGEYCSIDIKKAIYYYTLAANNNFIDAQFMLGFIYYDENKGICDIDKSIYYFSIAADKNHKEAQFYLAMIYSNGLYITPNIQKAITYYTLAANNNHIYSQYIIGSYYCDGKYIAPNYELAIKYLTLAANQNDPKAQCKLGYIY